MEPSSSGLVIDWRLILLQAGNFLLLLGVLSYLVWKPLLAHLDSRRQAIAEGLAAAQAQKEAAAAADQDRRKILDQARAQATQLIAETKTLLKEERTQLKAELVMERQRFQDSAAKDLAGQRAKLEAEVRQSLIRLVAKATERILADRDDQAKDWQPQVTKVIKEMT